MVKKNWITKNITSVLEMSKWMGSTPKAFKAAILKEAVRQKCEQRWEGGKEGNKSMQSRKA